jgi:hypothetical protein
MPVFRRKRAEVAPASPETPETLVGLLYAVSKDWGQTFRLLTIVSVTLLVLCLSVALGLDIVLLATKGLRGVTARFLPVWVFAGGSFLALITAVAKKLLQRRRAAGSSGGTSTSRR